MPHSFLARRRSTLLLLAASALALTLSPLASRPAAAQDVARMDQVIRASSDEARLLLCEDDAPLPRLQGAVFDSRNRLVELCSALWSSKVRLNFSSR